MAILTPITTMFPLDEEYEFVLIQETEAGKVGQPAQGPTEVHIRVRDSSGFDRIRTITFGKGIQARVGFKNGRSQVISLLFDKSKWTSEEARKWYQEHKTSLASIAEAALYQDTAASIMVEPDLMEEPAETFGFDVPDPTPTKAYAVFKLLSFFPVVNQRRDTFDEADVKDEAIASLVGSPIYGNESLTDHFMKSGTRGPQVGAVLDAKKQGGDGIYALAAVYKDILADKYHTDPKELPKGFSVSMEVKFDPEQTRYKVNNTILDRGSAISSGVADVIASNDDPQKYAARFLVPIEYHAVALLRRGRNADPTADFLLAAASKESTMDQIEWSQEDFDSFIVTAKAYGAEISYKERKALSKSDFAYMDDKGVGHLPIMDAAHVRNALARLNQTDIPLSAKKSALRKILAAARKFGIKVSEDSDVRKAYGAMHTLEERQRMVKEMMNEKKKRKVAKASQDFDILADATNTILFIQDGALYRARLDFNDDQELAVQEIEALAQISPIEEKTKMSEEELKAREEALKAESDALKAKEYELSKAAVDKFKASEEFKALIDEAKSEAVEDHKKTQQTIASRMKELETIHPFKDEDERKVLETKVVESVANDMEWLKVKNERYETALASTRRKAKPPVTPSLTAATASQGRKRMFDYTGEE